MSNYTSNSYVEDSNTPWYKIVKKIKKNSTVLDVGCSAGGLGEVIKDRTNSKVFGVEIDEGDAKKAAKVLDGIYTTNLELEEIPETLAQKKFDYIIFCDVIEHFAWPSETLRKIKKILKPDGKIIFSIPNMSHMSVRLMLLEGNFTYGETGLLDKTHLHFYDRHEIEKVFHQAGFKIDDLDWVSRDMPKEILEQKLKKQGLTPSSQFLEIRNNVDAAAYQYVGSATANANMKISQVTRPDVSPDIHDVEDFIGSLTKQIDNHSKELANALSAKHQAELNAETADRKARALQSEINSIKSSKSYRASRKLGKTIKTIKKPFRAN